MTGPTITVASYNMRKAIGIDRRRNPERVLEVLKEIHADVVALQEVTARTWPLWRAALQTIGLPHAVCSLDGADPAREDHEAAVIPNASSAAKGMTSLVTHSSMKARSLARSSSVRASNAKSKADRSKSMTSSYPLFLAPIRPLIRLDTPLCPVS